MDRKQFTFYDSFAIAAKKLKSKQARCEFYDAICDYALHETEPDLETISDAAAMGYALVKPILDASRRKAKSGQKGGSAKADEKQEETESIEEAYHEQEEDESKPEANEEQEEDESKNKDKKKDKKKNKDKCLNTPLTPQRREQMIYEVFNEHRADLPMAVLEWVQYKIEKRQPYQETGLRNLLAQIRNSADEYGDEAMVNVIRRSMSANYQGIVFDWLKKEPQPKPKQYTTQENYTAPAKKLTVDELYGLVDKI